MCLLGVVEFCYYQLLHNDSAIINYYIMILEQLCVINWCDVEFCHYQLLHYDFGAVVSLNVSTGVMWNSAIINYYIMILEQLCVINWCDVEFCYYQLLHNDFGAVVCH